jgi:hypothetical protein
MIASHRMKKQVIYVGKGENPSNIAKPLSDIAGKSLESLSSHTNYMRNRTCMKQGCQDPPGFINLSSRYGSTIKLHKDLTLPPVQFFIAQRWQRMKNHGVMSCYIRTIIIP